MYTNNEASEKLRYLCEELDISRKLTARNCPYANSFVWIISLIIVAKRKMTETQEKPTEIEPKWNVEQMLDDC